MTENPLKQYFRKPAVYIRLPSEGKGYPEGTIDLPPNFEIPIYPMSALDEITARTPDALYNGTAVVEIIRSCVPNIKDPWSIVSQDLDPILIAIRAASVGETMEFETECPECHEDSKFDINLPSLLMNFKPKDYGEPLALGDITIKFRPLNFKELNEANLAQVEIQKILSSLSALDDDEQKTFRSKDALERINLISFDIISKTVEYIRIPGATVFEHEFIREFLRNCDNRTFTRIKDYSIDLKQSTENKPLHIKCLHCEHEYDQGFSVNVSDFFV